MVFPLAELKFARIHRRDNKSIVDVLLRIYRVDDGGLDTGGKQIYARTLKLERTVSLAAGVSKAQILADARQRLSDYMTQQGWSLPPEQIVCTL